MSQFDEGKIKSCFPALNIKKDPVHYLDSAATCQKPTCVIQSIVHCYEKQYANVHRGSYRLSEKATSAYEETRNLVARFLGGVHLHEVIFTSGTTAAINLVARTWGEENLRPGDEILLLISEHHSNIVPWQILAKKTGAVIRFVPLNENMLPDLNILENLFSEKTKLFAFAHVSNVTGMIYPVKAMVQMARKHGILTLIDGAQAVPHLPIDVHDIGCDFYCFSGHKMCGPSGIGILWGKDELLEKMPPFMGGGDMIASVTTEGSTWNKLPYKLEAGTPGIASAIGLGAAIRFLQQIDMQAALEHDQKLGTSLINALRDVPGIYLLTPGADNWVGIVSFFHKSIHPHDMAAFADARSVCIRAGHHCAQPFMNWLKIPAACRVSPYIYNDENDIREFILAFQEAEKTLCG
ncbi:MAG: SufS family cysteine desulfurase [Deltaproteobacteria bacterium]|nr:SufS family cysteine desulfurase [Deltaproteobacteria bacterium]